MYKDVPLLWAPSHRKMKRFSLTQRLAANSRDVLSALTGQSGSVGSSVGSSVSLSELNAANLLVVNMKRRQSAWKRSFWLEGKSWPNPQIKYIHVWLKNGLSVSQLGKQVSGSGLNHTPWNQPGPRYCNSQQVASQLDSIEHNTSGPAEQLGSYTKHLAWNHWERVTSVSTHQQWHARVANDINLQSFPSI